MSMDLSEQYDKIYRYCYYKLRHREQAEDVTQETFLRFFRSYEGREQSLPLLYTIARNLCTDEYRKRQDTPLKETADDPQSAFEDDYLQNAALQTELDKLSAEDRELILLRYVNEVPLGTLCAMYGISRFALYRRCRRLLSDLKHELEG